MTKDLYVGNLSATTTEESLRNTFGQAGRSVRNVTIVTSSKNGRPRGFAFLEMASEEEVKAAIEAHHGMELDGRTINVNEAKNRPVRSGGFGSRSEERDSYGSDGGGYGGYGGGRDRGGR